MHSVTLDGSGGSPRKRTISRGLSEDESLRSIIKEVRNHDVISDGLFRANGCVNVQSVFHFLNVRNVTSVNVGHFVNR